MVKVWPLWKSPLMGMGSPRLPFIGWTPLLNLIKTKLSAMMPASRAVETRAMRGIDITFI